MPTVSKITSASLIKFLPMSPQVRNGMPRLVDVILATGGLFVTAPLVGLAAMAVALTSRGPAIFRQGRVGRGGRMFTLYKIRTMHCANVGPGVTGKHDERITFVGKILRKSKIDELPELWNVVKGDMALVGPRPEVPCYVDLNDPKWRTVLEARPGITDPITMRLRNEEDLLGMVSDDRENFYLTVLQPLKIDGYLKYLRERNWWSDLGVLWKSMLAVVVPRVGYAPTLGDLPTRGLGYRD